ncbi:MAG: hypothetical protein WC451_05925 [Patescibacteria group bacterium]
MATYNRTPEVTQLNNPGGMGHGKWFVSRGSGRDTEYLRKDYTWHKDISRGGFLWDTEAEAKKAKQTIIEQEDTPPP